MEPILVTTTAIFIGCSVYFMAQDSMDMALWCAVMATFWLNVSKYEK